jgi:hypothetical protein
VAMFSDGAAGMASTTGRIQLNSFCRTIPR